MLGRNLKTVLTKLFGAVVVLLLTIIGVRASAGDGDCVGCLTGTVTASNSVTQICAITCFKETTPSPGVCFYSPNFGECLWTNCSYDYTITCCVAGTGDCTRICKYPQGTVPNVCSTSGQPSCLELSDTVTPECGSESLVEFWVGSTQFRKYHFPCTECALPP